MKKITLIMFSVLLCTMHNAYSDSLNNILGVFDDDVKQKIADEKTIATLQNDLRLLDIEIEKCEKQKRGWTAATVVGAVGVVSTGVAAGVQAGKLKNQKNTIQGKDQEISSLKSENK